MGLCLLGASQDKAVVCTAMALDGTSGEADLIDEDVEQLAAGVA